MRRYDTDLISFIDDSRGRTLFYYQLVGDLPLENFAIAQLLGELLMLRDGHFKLNNLSVIGLADTIDVVCVD
jgi:hypothetical protein